MKHLVVSSSRVVYSWKDATSCLATAQETSLSALRRRWKETLRRINQKSMNIDEDHRRF